MDYSDNPRVSFDEQGNMTVEGVEVKVKSIVFENKKAMDIAYKDLKNSFDLGAVSAEQFYAELENLRDYYLEDGSAAWWQYTKQILSYEQSLKEEQEKARQDMIDRRMAGLSALYTLGEFSARDYYNALENLRDEFFEKDSKEWQSYTVSLGKFYKKQLDEAKENSEALTDKLFGSIMHHYTIKDKDGKITDSFYKLISPDTKDAEKFLEGFSYLSQNGAPSFVLSDYLSRSPRDADEVLNMFRALGDKLPGYFAEISQTRSEISAMTNSFFNTDALKSAVNEIVSAIRESGMGDGIDITQNFYGGNLTPSEISAEVANTLRLQGVNL